MLRNCLIVCHARDWGKTYFPYSWFFFLKFLYSFFVEHLRFFILFFVTKRIINLLYIQSRKETKKNTLLFRCCCLVWCLQQIKNCYNKKWNSSKLFFSLKNISCGNSFWKKKEKRFFFGISYLCYRYCLFTKKDLKS